MYLPWKIKVLDCNSQESVLKLRVARVATSFVEFDIDVDEEKQDWQKNTF